MLQKISKMKNMHHDTDVESGMAVLDGLSKEFVAILGIKHLELARDPDFFRRCLDLAAYLSQHELKSKKERRRGFLAHVNWKFRINSDHLALFYAKGAKLGQTFNYHQKCAIQLLFDRGERNVSTYIAPVL
ncbi:hypothetical protein P8S54_08060 [Thiomicrospira sp. R3]|uniref:hypothetical protein n=1 Tax=Thiomicrospira sp. R3 TaxID=3035472 RepID=UPI00259B0F0B|nr:hypothetical protein [Thiomicrospira sp. R3]WFE68170.1 hypothetical protein P8S54_08060 [Thiomicrospira sp. R3]